MENCVTCDTAVEPTTPVSSGDCQCVQNPQGVQRETRLLAPTRHEYSEWSERDPLVPEGVLCMVKDRLFEGSLEYFIGDGTHTFTELTTFAGAPLSRTGAENHSPLAAEGKSTLDPSWLPAATSSALGAVKTSTTGANGKVPIGGSGNKLDASWLPAATSSALGAVYTSATGAAGKVPVAGSDGKLDSSWLPALTVDSAPKLTTPRTFLTDLASTTAAAFDGTANNVHGITGTLPVSHGGTGATDLAAVTVGAATSAESATKANKLDPGASITVTMIVDGTTHSDTETFTGENGITLNLGNITTGGGGGTPQDLSGLMPKLADSGVGHMVYISDSGFGKDDGDTTGGGNSFSFPVNSVWYFFGTCTDSQPDDNSTSYVVSRRFTISSGGTGGFQAAWQAAGFTGAPGGWLVRLS